MTAELPPVLPPGRPADPPSIPPFATEQSSGMPPPRPPKPAPPPTSARQLPTIPPQEISPRVNRRSPLEDELMSAYMDEAVPGKKPSPPESVMTEAVDVLLDFGDAQPQSSMQGAQVPVNNNLGGPSVDLLADLFGTTTITPTGPSLQPEVKQNPVQQPMAPAPAAQPASNLLDDLDLFGNDITSTVRHSFCNAC